MRSVCRCSWTVHFADNVRLISRTEGEPSGYRGTRDQGVAVAAQEAKARLLDHLAKASRTQAGDCGCSQRLQEMDRAGEQV